MGKNFQSKGKCTKLEDYGDTTMCSFFPSFPRFFSSFTKQGMKFSTRAPSEVEDDRLKWRTIA